MTLDSSEFTEFSKLANYAFGRIDQLVESNGPARGARRLRMVTGGGLEVEVHPDRAIDIGRVTFDGIPMAFVDADGIPSPAVYPSHTEGWLYAFGGGLMVTCGLDSYGTTSSDEGIVYPQHGRVSSIPGDMTEIRKVGNLLVVEGIVRQSVIGGPRLSLRRRIETPVGGTEIRVLDRVTNESATFDAVHMMMYHVNFGWPLLSPSSRLVIPPSKISPRDEISEKNVHKARLIEPPLRDHQSEVFLHEFTQGQEITVVLENDEIGLRTSLSFHREQLPYLCEWKYRAFDSYVLGLEPINTRTVKSREDAKNSEVLKVLAPGQSVDYELRFLFERTNRTGKSYEVDNV